MPPSETLEARVIRIEEKVAAIQKELHDHKEDFKDFKENDFRDLICKLDDKDKAYYKDFLLEKAFKDWVISAFNPIRLFVWGIIGMIAGGALTAGLSFLFRKP